MAAGTVRSMFALVGLSLALTCTRQATDLEDYERACASYCDKRFECLDPVPWLDPTTAPMDTAECTRRCTESAPEAPACIEAGAAYSECLGALTCAELASFYADPYAEVAEHLCFVEFERASDCE